MNFEQTLIFGPKLLMCNK